MKQVLLVLLAMCVRASAEMPPELRWPHDLANSLRAKGSVLLDIHTSDDGSRSFHAVTEEQMARCPPWDGNGDPPLAISGAVELARVHLSKKSPKYDHFPLTRASIKSIQCADLTNRWCYALDFVVKFPLPSPELNEGEWIEGEGWSSESFAVYMMLDGTILEPEPIGTEKTANKPSEATP